MKIYLIRHGETDWNRLLRFQGREDIALNEHGEAQARACGKKLAAIGKVTRIYTSPLKRAVRTGELLAETLGLDKDACAVLGDLTERDLGSYSGAYIKDRQDYFAIAAGMDKGDMERFCDVRARMERALCTLAGCGAEEVAAVSHGAAINVLLSVLSDGALGTGKTKLCNGSITILEGDASQGFRIAACNINPMEG